ncbi:Pectinesterase [Rhynchospora pubera]|uniref:Pectinesterase n=1 Tax=Rhynchospora pubera TaxID=906938 RepID=A0AAV8G1U4_9POAL|nr:Pectinesterase [Rhynchospora pubera]
MAKTMFVGLTASVLVGILCASAIITLVHSTKIHHRRHNLHSSIHHTTLKARRTKGNSLCATALHKESCELMLSKLAPKPSKDHAGLEASCVEASQSEIFTKFIDVKITELEKAVKLSADVANGTVGDRTAAAKADCRKLLMGALQYARAAYAHARDKDLKGLTAEAENIQHMLTASMTYMYTCVDSFEDTTLNAEMEGILSNATVMGSNALGVINTISSTAAKTKTLQPTSMKLMVYDADQQGYPTWLSSRDRKLVQEDSPKPDAVVAKDGSGQFKTINDALEKIPVNHTGRYVIYLKAGVYDEIVKVPRETKNLYMYGDGADKSVVTGKLSNVETQVTTRLTATFTIEGQNFTAKSIGFKNSAGAVNHQAVALRISGDFGAFFKCSFDGFQDTLYTHTGRQFFRECNVSGTIDFIFGNSAVVFQNCLITCNRPLDNQQNTITAHGRTDPNMKTGVVLQNCRIVADKGLVPDKEKLPSYLGRPWKMYSRAVVMESFIDDYIHPEGWYPWNGDFALKTLYFAEYGNTGPGANTTGRVKWPTFHVITKADATQFTAGPFINANEWLASTGVPNYLGFKA